MSVSEQRAVAKRMLVAFKLLHTAVWACFVACIVALPFAALADRFDWAVALTVAVLLECTIIAVNAGRCPLTDIAARYTEERADNFDIYLPVWLARHNKVLFGTLFVLNEIVVIWLWVSQRGG